MLKPHISSGGRYPVLRSLAILYLLSGCVAAIAALGVALWALISGPGDMVDRLIMAIGALAAGFFVTITAFAIAEVLKLFIDVEHNTRMAGHVQAPAASTGDGMRAGGRIGLLEDEPAEVALMRGH